MGAVRLPTKAYKSKHASKELKAMCFWIHVEKFISNMNKTRYIYVQQRTPIGFNFAACIAKLYFRKKVLRLRLKV